MQTAYRSTQTCAMKQLKRAESQSFIPGDMPVDLGSQPLGWTISSELLPGLPSCGVLDADSDFVRLHQISKLPQTIHSICFRSLTGTVVGQGRYVLAEKLCEVCRLPESTSQPQHLALPLPNQRSGMVRDGDG